MTPVLATPRTTFLFLLLSPPFAYSQLFPRHRGRQVIRRLSIYMPYHICPTTAPSSLPAPTPARHLDECILSVDVNAEAINPVSKDRTTNGNVVKNGTYPLAPSHSHQLGRFCPRSQVGRRDALQLQLLGLGNSCLQAHV